MTCKVKTMKSTRARPIRFTLWVQLFLLCLLIRSTCAETSRMPLLMPDDFTELQLTGWRIEPGIQDPENPLIEGDMPWDAGGVGIHGSVFEDPIDGQWKAYLVCTPPEETSQGWKNPWSSDNAYKRRLCYFESSDGVHWERPQLPYFPFGEYEKTNIVFNLSGGLSAYSSVIVDPANKRWPYQMFLLREVTPYGSPPQGTGYYRYRSRDGEEWVRFGGPIKEPMKGDLAFFYRTGPKEYISYYRLGGDPQEWDHLPVYEDGARRTVYRATSVDGEHWVQDPATVLTADERDHRDTQYQELVPLRVPAGYLGMVTIYRPITQTLNVRLAASRDGRRWWYPDRRPCLDNAPLGDYGGGMIWQSQNLIVEDDRLLLYYGGTEGPHRQISDTRAPSQEIGMETVIDHGGHFIPFNAALCRASWRFDRLYALISSPGGPTLGMAVTKPLQLAGRILWVNVVTRPAKKSAKVGFDEGYLQVELLDEEGDQVPGFTRKDCELIQGDFAAFKVKWRKGDRAPKEAVKAKFYLKRAFLYGFEIRD